MMTRPKTFSGYFLPFRFFYIALYRYDVSEYSDIGEKMRF